MQTHRLELLRKDNEWFRLRLMHGSAVVYDGEVQHQAIVHLLDTSKKHYRNGAPCLDVLGRDLFSLINLNGALHAHRESLQQPMALHISSEGEMAHLPWELLHDGRVYLATHPTPLFTPLRCVSPRNYGVRTPANRPMHLLFMAASAENVEPVLDFEREEAAILEASEKQPLLLQVEESGSLDGLREQVESWPDEHFDALHISGHADIIDGQPYFIMENAVGEADNISAEQLARVFSDSGRLPQLLFLSGCRTGEANQEQGIPSLCEALVKQGLPAVLGWGLPVGDHAATAAASVLYGSLARGVALDRAVALARQKLWELKSPYWHQLRLYADTTPLSPLVTAPRTPGRTFLQRPQHTREFLDKRKNQVAVCGDSAFIGRRRLLQRSIHALRRNDAMQPDGLLLLGMGGSGKSSAAARLAGRMRHTHHIAVCVGGLDEQELIKLLGNEGMGATLNDAGDLSQRLRHGFAQLDQPLLLIFDDFEQNIAAKTMAGGKAEYRPAALTTLHALMQAIHQIGGGHKVLLTSRYDVPLPTPLCWHTEMLQSLRGADLHKKEKQLPSWSDDSITEGLRQRASELAAGNPRLLERLDTVLQQRNLDITTLFATLEKKEAEFREEILLETLLESLPRKVRRLLAAMACYHLPMPLSAIFACATLEHPLPDAPLDETECKQSLQQAAALGLVEAVKDHYFISFLLHGLLRHELDQGEQQHVLQHATHFLAAALQDNAQAALATELLRLATAAGDRSIAIPLANRLAYRANEENRCREAAIICRNTLRLGDDFRLLHQLGRAEMRLGASDAPLHFKQALRLSEQIDTMDSSDTQRDVAALQFDYCSLLIQQGSMEQALQRLQESVLPTYEQLGDVRSRAMTMGKIADILQSRGNLDEALRIRQQEELPVYEQLGDVRERAVTMGKIADILQSRGNLDEALRIRQQEELPVYEQLGDVRERAVTMGKIADILQSRGNLDEALRMLQDEVLPAFEQLGDVHSCAVTMGKIANILQSSGKLDEALRIRREKLPVYEQMGDVRSLLVGRTNLAMLLLKIDPSTHQQEIKALFTSAYIAAMGMQLPEAKQIAGIMQQAGIDLPEQAVVQAMLENFTLQLPINR